MKTPVAVLAFIGSLFLAVAMAVVLLRAPASLEATTPGSGCADIDGDGAVTWVDVIIVASYFGQASPPKQVDFDGSGIVGVFDDVLPVAGQFGTVTSCQTKPLAQPAPAPGGEMSLAASGGSVTCDLPQKPAKCSVPTGDQFTVSVEVNTLPSNNYVGFQTQIVFGSLTYKPTAQAGDEIVWPESSLTGRKTSTPGNVYHGDMSGVTSFPVSTHTGNVVQIAVDCPPAPGAFLVALPSYSAGNPLGAAFVSGGLVNRPPLSTGTEMVDINGDTSPETVSVADSLAINCVDPLETTSSTIGAAGGVVGTGNTDAVEAQLVVPPGALAADTNVTVDVFSTADLSLPPGGGDYLSRAFDFGPDGTTFSTPAGLVISYTDAEVAGMDENNLDLWTHNSTTGEWELATVLLRNTVANTITVAISHFSHLTGRDGSTADFDDDGCTDTTERGPDERFGGRRNLRNEWDFYDVDDDHAVNIFTDVIPISQAFGGSGGPNYSPAKDRTDPPHPSYPADLDPWDMGPPDGFINVFTDILGAAGQYGHRCEP